MNLSVKKLITSGILIVGLAVVGMGLVSVGTPASVSADAHPCIQFEGNGKPLGKAVCNQAARGMVVEFAGKAEAQFTKDGKNIGVPITSPKGAKSFVLRFFSDCKIWGFQYKDKDGYSLMEPEIDVPLGTNDFHFKTKGKVSKMYWAVLVDDVLVAENVDVPKKADSIDFSCGGK